MSVIFEKIGNVQAEAINKHEIEVLGKIAAIFMKNGAASLKSILGAEVEIPTPTVAVENYKDLTQKLNKPYVRAQVEYTGDLNGRHILLIKKQSSESNGAMDLDAGNIKQMMLSIKNSMTELFGVSINSPEPEIMIVENEEKIDSGENYIAIRFPFRTKEKQIGEIVELLPLDFGKVVINFLVQKNISGNGFTLKESAGPREGRKINIRPIELQSFENGNGSDPVKDDGINLIIDVPLQLSVVLGRCKKTIKEILELNIGSVVVLDKLAGELVDVIVNGKLIARGEVVVIDENYGVRITEIVNQVSRQRV